MPSENEELALREWRRRGVIIRRALGFDGPQLDFELAEVFSVAVVEPYFRPVERVVKEVLGKSDEEWGAHFGKERRTIARWPRTMTLHQFVFTLLTYEIEFGGELEWPSNLSVVVGAYAEALAHIERRVLGTANVAYVTLEELVTLDYAARSVGLLIAEQNADVAGIDRELEIIGRRVDRYLGRETSRSPKELSRVVERRRRAWAVFLTGISYQLL